MGVPLKLEGCPLIRKGEEIDGYLKMLEVEIPATFVFMRHSHIQRTQTS